jgi:hypothetical protein
MTVFVNKAMETRLVCGDGIDPDAVSRNNASHVAGYIQALRCKQSISLEFTNANYLEIIQPDGNIRELPEQGNIYIGEIYMGPEILINAGFNETGNFSFEDIRGRQHKACYQQQGNPCDPEDFGFHSFSGIGLINSTVAAKEKPEWAPKGNFIH